jgi:galactokinase
VLITAPGRANLIGEHTDYNGGFVLPVALELATSVAGRHVDDQLRLLSLDRPGRTVVDLRSGDGPTTGWGRYATAVVRALLKDDLELHGFEGVVATDLPIGSGLGSSAALELAVAAAITDGIEPLRLAALCTHAENEYAGVECGIMDQLTTALGAQGHALLIDCETARIEPVPLPDYARILVIDSGIGRELRVSAYNERRAECRLAAAALKVSSLRSVSADDLRGLIDQPVPLKRARHVVSENRRVLAVADALRTGDISGIGSLFAESHRSYAVDFEASTPEIDELVAIAGRTPGVFASRLTGGGFGGCTVNLVDRSRAAQAAGSILAAYEKAMGLSGRAWISAAASGLSVDRL